MFDTANLKVLEAGLNAASLRQTVISDNISNIDTPGFKKSDVIFEDLLSESLKQSDNLPLTTTNPAHFSNSEPMEVKPLIKQDLNTSLRPDGNNVDIDQQMTVLAKNGIYYDTLVKQISSQLGVLRMVISEKP